MKKGITFGAFDLFHAGHVMMLQEAKKQCDHLIVCIQTDPSVDRDCLLYTSPSPRDATLSRMPSTA